jgi:hypothetical protein
MMTEQKWVQEYFKRTEKPLPLILGTRGTWSANGKPMIILIGFTIVDVLTLGDLHGVAHHPVRVMKLEEFTYYAINIINKKRVKEIIADWKKV